MAALTGRAQLYLHSFLLAALIGCANADKYVPITETRVNMKEDGSIYQKKWFGFTPYPGARQLCEQSVDGWADGRPMGIVWRSYATQDATEQVTAFYAREAGGNTEIEGKSITIRRPQVKPEATLSVHVASAGDYPRCDSKPRPEEKTVIIVSSRSR